VFHVSSHFDNRLSKDLRWDLAGVNNGCNILPRAREGKASEMRRDGE
jgi:hypothetical protein